MARARTILATVLLVLFVGCNGADSGRAQLVPPRTEPSLGAADVIKVAKAGEVDIAEHVAMNRQAYRKGLELLVQYYTNTGNNMKLIWAKKELAALDSMQQYDYLVEASLAGPGLRAIARIPEADDLYWAALQLEKKARGLVIIVDENLLRLALDKYNQLIKKHPSSDKIDDAAYKAGRIYEHFKDYTLAALYYQRAYQWDAETIYPARFRAAFILDKRLHRRAEALELYQQAIKKENLSVNYKEFAEERIREFTKSDEELE